MAASQRKCEASEALGAIERLRGQLQTERRLSSGLSDKLAAAEALLARRDGELAALGCAMEQLAMVQEVGAAADTVARDGGLRLQQGTDAVPCTSPPQSGSPQQPHRLRPPGRPAYPSTSPSPPPQPYAVRHRTASAAEMSQVSAANSDEREALPDLVSALLV